MKMTPASRFKRFLAFFIDILIVAIPSFFLYSIYYIRYGTFVLPPTFEYAMSAINIVIGLFYFVLFESSSYRATFGKQLFNLYVSDLNDQRITFSRALGRYLLYALPSFITMITNPNNGSMFDFKANQYDSYFSFITVILVIIWIIPIYFTQARTTIYDMLSSTRVNKNLSLD